MKITVKRPFFLTGCIVPAAISIIMITGTKHIVPVFAVALILGIAVFIKQKDKAIHSIIALISVAVALLSFMLSENRYNAVSVMENINTTVTGTVTAFPAISTNGSFATEISSYTADGKRIPGKLLIYTENEPAAVPGDKVSAKCEALRLSATEGSFYYHNLSNKIFFTSESDTITVTKEHGKYNIYNKILILRKAANEKLKCNISAESAALTSALITGNKSELSHETDSAMRTSGISHIFAVSGMHLSLWTGVFFIIMKSRSKVSVLPNIAAIIFVLFYIVFTGFSPSVLRSGFMLIPSFMASILRKKADALNSLGFAGTLLLLYNPFLAGNVSFLLSYTATFAIVAIAPYFNINKLSITENTTLNKGLSLTINPIITTLCVISATLPITTVFFGYISLISPLSSLLMTPLAELVMTAGASAILIPSGNIISKLLFGITEFACGLITKYIITVKNWDFVILPTDIKVIIPFFTLGAVAAIIFILFPKKHKTAIGIFFSGIILSLTASLLFSFVQKDKTEIEISISAESAYIAAASADGNSVLYTEAADYDDIRNATAFFNYVGQLCIDKYFSGKFSYSEDSVSKLLIPSETHYLYRKSVNPYNRIPLWDNCSFSYERFSDKTITAFTVDGIKIVYYPDDLKDNSLILEEFRNGTVLICRDEDFIKEFSPQFDEIIICGNKNSDSEAIHITIKGDTYAIH